MSGSKRKTGTSLPNDVPKAVVSRLSLYLRELQHLLRAGKETINSSGLGELLGFTDAQVRKDLAYFGQFGHPGVGYKCQELVDVIRSILGTDRDWVVAIVGVGNLGRALLGYRGFESQGFRLAAAFDADPSKIGLTYEGLAVEPLADLEKRIDEYGITLGLIAAPAEAAQELADRLVAAGVVGILNFAPITLNLPENVSLVAVDLATELEQLSFSVANRPTVGPISNRPSEEEPVEGSKEGPQVGPVSEEKTS